MRHTCGRLAALLVLLLALTAGWLNCGQGEGKGPESDPPTDGKLDSFGSPTDHGRIAFGQPVVAEIDVVTARFHMWTWELTDAAEVTVTTGPAGGGDVDTVIYLYQRQASGFWGRYLAKDDDSGDEPFSRLTSRLGRGEFRVLVKGHARTTAGPFEVVVDCSGAGCAAPDTTSVSLRVPLIDEDGEMLLSSLNPQIVAQGLEPLADYVEVSRDDPEAFGRVVDYIEDEVNPAIGEVHYPLGYATPNDYEVEIDGRELAICYRGDRAQVVLLAEELVDSVFSDQFTIWAWRYGDEVHHADWVEVENEDVQTYPAQWHAFDGTDGSVLLLVSVSDSGDEREPNRILPCTP